MAKNSPTVSKMSETPKTETSGSAWGSENRPS